MKYLVNDGFLYYIELIGDKDYKKLFKSSLNFDLLDTINEEQANYRYESVKWSIKQVIGHITDHERIMLYRILRLSRNDTSLLSGYDQNLLVDNSRFNELSFRDLVVDLKNVRIATNSFIDSLSELQLGICGKVLNYNLSCEDYLKATIGHEVHHINIIKDKYLT